MATPSEAPRCEQRRYSRMVIAGDVLTVAACVGAGIMLGLSGSPAADRALIVSGLLSAVLLIGSLVVARAWGPGVLGQGSTELFRLGRAVAGADVALSLGGLALMVDSVRPWVFLLVPVSGVLCLGSRFVLRKWLHHRRRDERFVLSVLAVGSEQAVADLVRRTRRDPYFGWRVTGACTPTGSAAGGRPEIDDVPVRSSATSIPSWRR